MTTEAWVLIPGWTHYEVSDMGRVRSLDRGVRGPYDSTHFIHGRILKQIIDGQGYNIVNLCEKPQRRVARVQYLVAEAFLGPRLKGVFVLHWDDDPENNHLSNLRYGTHSDNMHDAVRNGHHHNAAKDVCDQGHQFNEGNIYRRPDGGRRCRACHRIRSADDYRAKKKSTKEEQ